MQVTSKMFQLTSGHLRTFSNFVMRHKRMINTCESQMPKDCSVKLQDRDSSIWKQTFSLVPVKLRPATAADYQAVLNIGLVYGEDDYLPYMFKRFLAEDYISYVCEVDGEIVSYMAALLHDGGEVAQFRAARTKTCHRGNGYWTLLKNTMINEIMQTTNASNAICIRVVKTMASIKSNKWSERMVDRYVKYSGVISCPKIDSFIMPCHLNKLQEGDLRIVFEDVPLCQYLFPKKIIYSQEIGLGVHECNIKHLINNNSSVYVSMVPQDNCNTEVLFPRNIQFLSTGTVTPLPRGLKLDIAIFGNNISELQSHVLAHLGDLNTQTEIIVNIQTPHSVSAATVESVLKSFGIPDPVVERNVTVVQPLQDGFSVERNVTVVQDAHSAIRKLHQC